MSDVAPEQAFGPLQQTLVQHFAEAASTVLSQIAGTALQAEPVAPTGSNGEAATLLRIEISGALQGVCEVALTAAMSAHFAALLTGEAPDLSAAEISGDTREAAAELIQQICGNAADRLRRAYGPLELKPHLAEADPDSGTRHLFQITGGDPTLEFAFHILRLAQPEPVQPEPVQPEPAPSPEPVTVPAPAPPAAAPQPASQSAAPKPAQSVAPSTQQSSDSASPGTLSAPFANRNLDLLLDIELGVTLRFGTTRMLLKDIIELCSGSVVELDRRVEEPVELLIDGHLIAQGEVVIVEGNYGLRITQVADPGEKIACLR
jgi:flagellar motor switch protein FliN/FliY